MKLSLLIVLALSSLVPVLCAPVGSDSTSFNFPGDPSTPNGSLGECNGENLKDVCHPGDTKVTQDTKVNQIDSDEVVVRIPEILPGDPLAAIFDASIPWQQLGPANYSKPGVSIMSKPEPRHVVVVIAKDPSDKADSDPGQIMSLFDLRGRGYKGAGVKKVKTLEQVKDEKIFDISKFKAYETGFDKAVSKGQGDEYTNKVYEAQKEEEDRKKELEATKAAERAKESAKESAAAAKKKLNEDISRDQLRQSKNTRKLLHHLKQTSNLKMNLYVIFPVAADFLVERPASYKLVNTKNRTTPGTKELKRVYQWIPVHDGKLYMSQNEKAVFNNFISDLRKQLLGGIPWINPDAYNIIPMRRDPDPPKKNPEGKIQKDRNGRTLSGVSVVQFKEGQLFINDDKVNKSHIIDIDAIQRMYEAFSDWSRDFRNKVKIGEEKKRVMELAKQDGIRYTIVANPLMGEKGYVPPPVTRHKITEE